MKPLIFSLAIALSFSFSLKKDLGSEVSGKIEVIRNVFYKGKDREALFKATYLKPGSIQKRYFEVIKTDYILKDQFLVDYIMVEKVYDKVKIYPLGWLGDKILESDVKYNCKIILKGEVRSLDPD